MLVDPAQPSLTVLELQEGSAHGRARWCGLLPFPVTVVPDDLPR